MTMILFLSHLCMSLIKWLKTEKTLWIFSSHPYHTVWANKLWNHNQLYNKKKHMDSVFLSYMELPYTQPQLFKSKQWSDIPRITVTALPQAIFNRLWPAELPEAAGNHLFIHFHYPLYGPNSYFVCQFQKTEKMKWSLM